MYNNNNNKKHKDLDYYPRDFTNTIHLIVYTPFKEY